MLGLGQDDISDRGDEHRPPHPSGEQDSAAVTRASAVSP